MARVYVAGPMAGKPDLNFPEFAAVAARLRERGHDVVSPLEIGRHHFGGKTDLDPHDYLTKDILELLTCDAICLMEGWSASTGASCEAAIAYTLGFDFMDEYGNWIDSPRDICIRTYGKRKADAAST